MRNGRTFHDAAKSLGDALQELIDGIRGESVTLRELMDEIGEQGLLLVCALACLPFLIPVSIPGVSTVFGAAIILISVAIFLNRMPWLPKRILDRPMDSAKLIPALKKGAGIVSRIERYIRPRLLAVTGSSAINRLNAVAITAGGVLLMFPLGLVPFSNTLPAIAILLTTIGMIQRDGLMVLGGYLFLILTTVYFSVLGFWAFRAGQGAASLLG